MEQLFRKTLVLSAENQVGVVGVGGITVDRSSFCSKVEEVSVMIFIEEIFKTVVIGYVELIPVIESRTLEVLVADFEAERSDEMQPCSRNSTGS